jgi:hypothetical protein
MSSTATTPSETNALPVARRNARRTPRATGLDPGRGRVLRRLTARPLTQGRGLGSRRSPQLAEAGADRSKTPQGLSPLIVTHKRFC